MADFIERRRTSVSCPPLAFSIFLPSYAARAVSVNTTNPPAIKHRHDRAAVPLFWHFPPSFVPVPLFHLTPLVSLRRLPLRFRPFSFTPPAFFILSLPISLSPSLSLSLFFLTKLPLVCAYASSLYGSRPLVQQRIINYSPLRCACTRIFEKTAPTTRALPTKY